MIVAAEGVAFRYGNEASGAEVFSGIDFSIERGEIVALEGPSGSGKTTLLSVLSGLVRSTAGKVTLAGERLDALDDPGRARARRKHVGFVFQGYHLIAALSARENVAEALVLRGFPRAEARERATVTLGKLGLERLATRRPEGLSGGEKQRVAVARAAAGSPAIVFADEPTAALDFSNGKIVVGLLRDYARAGGTVLLVTHDVRLRPFVDRVVAMTDGRIEARIDPARSSDETGMENTP